MGSNPWSHKWLPTPVLGLPSGTVVKNSPVNARRHGFNPWVRKILWSRKWQPNPSFLPGKFQGQRSLVGLQSMGLQGVEHNRAQHRGVVKIVLLKQQAWAPCLVRDLRSHKQPGVAKKQTKIQLAEVTRVGAS